MPQSSRDLTDSHSPCGKPGLSGSDVSESNSEGGLCPLRRSCARGGNPCELEMSRRGRHATGSGQMPSGGRLHGPCGQRSRRAAGRPGTRKKSRSEKAKKRQGAPEGKYYKRSGENSPGTMATAPSPMAHGMEGGSRSTGWLHCRRMPSVASRHLDLSPTIDSPRLPLLYDRHGVDASQTWSEEC